MVITVWLIVQADQHVCSSSPAVLDRELPQSKQPGLVFEPGPAGTWDESAIGNPVVRLLSLPVFEPLSRETTIQLTEHAITMHQLHFDGHHASAVSLYAVISLAYHLNK